VREIDVSTSDGRNLHAYDRGGGDLVVVWHHGTPNIGTPPGPLFAAADRLGVRFVGYDRPRYGGSTAVPGRDVASAAGDVAAIADALGVERFAVMAHSGGGPHALACAALLPGRVTAVAAISCLAPITADGLDWFAGMGPVGEAGLRAAIAGPDAKAAHEAGGPMPDFLPADWAALEGEWGWFGSVVEPAMAYGPGPLIDDDVAYVSPWGFDPAVITAPVLLVHGAADTVVPAAQGAWLARHIPGARWREIPEAGHISVLPVAGVAALEWLADPTNNSR
jgi:pimeloyl-ACP methyl ester carboxylesterase